jgi:N6-adenosine-specific RNA methylase IME4
VRRLELFGRRKRPGWIVWGNQVEDGDQVEDGQKA